MRRPRWVSRRPPLRQRVFAGTLTPVRHAIQAFAIGAEDAAGWFRAIDLGGSGALDYRAFLLGLAATDPSSAGGGPTSQAWAEQRAQYVFRLYDVNQDGSMDFEELKVIIRHVINAKQAGTPPPSDEDVEHQALKLFPDKATQVGESEFVQVVGAPGQTVLEADLLLQSKLPPGLLDAAIAKLAPLQVLHAALAHAMPQAVL